MQLHHEVTLSCLWHVVKQSLYFVKCDCKHSDDQCIVKDVDTFYVDIELWVYENRDGHADHSK